MERVTLRLPEEDVKKLESLVSVGPLPNRSEGIREAVSEYINKTHDDPEAVDAFANAYLEDKIDYDQLAEFIGKEKAREICDKSGK